MSLRDRLGALDRTQRSRTYKLIASAVVVTVAIAAAVTALYLNQQMSSGQLGEALEREEAAREAYFAARGDESLELAERRARRDAFIAATEAASELRLERAEGGALVGPGVLNYAFPGIAAFAAVALAGVWIGLSLTYLALLAAGAAVGGLILAVPGLRGVGSFVLASLPLIVALLTLLEVARLALSPSHPVTAIARNVLNEAVRMKIGLVFIAFLLLLLAVVPLVLEEDQPLRYRVQQWLQYGGGMGYGVLAMLTAFFGCATVAFEQRDRRVWQTVTKPVAAWHYVLGKWTGLMVLNLVLLAVIASSVFMFTQYLRFQPARGEVAAFITEEGYDSRDLPAFMTDDRRKLENEVLVARVGVRPDPPDITDEVVERRVEAILSEQSRAAGGGEPGEREIRQARLTAMEQLTQLAYAIPQGGARSFTFSGLGDIRDAGGETTLNLRYRVHAGSDDPTAIYRLAFRFNGELWPPPDPAAPGAAATQERGVRQVGLDAVQLIAFPPSLINEDGELTVQIYNFPSNPRNLDVRVDRADFEIVYPVGGYELNFARAMAVLWVKLGFIAAVAIACSTFLGFPVAVLVTLGTMFAAESAGFLGEALESYSSITREGEVRYDKLVARNLTRPVAWLFESYAGLSPIERLTSGRLLSWGSLAMAMVQIAAWAAVILAIGVAVFRRRELAIYSGR